MKNSNLIMSVYFSNIFKEEDPIIFCISKSQEKCIWNFTRIPANALPKPYPHFPDYMQQTRKPVCIKAHFDDVDNLSFDSFESVFH